MTTNSTSVPTSLAATLLGTIEELRLAGHLRRSECLAATLRSFMAYRGGHDLPLAALTSAELAAYEGWLRRRGLCRNTTSFYMRQLRAAYNRAAARGAAPDGEARPFGNVYTGIDATAKRALSPALLRCVCEAPLRPGSTDEWARDLFMFSLLTRGMSFIDVAFLRRADVRGDVLTYRRRKTGRLLRLGWEPCMEQIVRKYTRLTEGTPYLLPVLTDRERPLRTQFQSQTRKLNRHLGALGQRLDLPIPLTLYVARHTWASLALHCQIPTATISQALGHRSEQTTRIYLAALDSRTLDTANRTVIASIAPP